MQAPDGEIEAAFLQSRVPRKDVLINAVDERAVKIENECRQGGKGFMIRALIPAT